jgi:hypothetical protein
MTDSNARKIEHDDELYNSLLVPGQCHDYGADVGLTDVPARGNSGLNR